MPANLATYRRPLAVAAAGLVVTAVAYAAAWLWTAAIARNEIARWIGRQRDQGLTVVIGDLRTDGFPGKIRITVPDIVVTAPVTNGGWSWRTSAVRFRTWPFAWQGLDLDVGGTHGVAGLATPPGVPFWLSSPVAGGTVRWGTGGRIESLELRADDLRIALAPDGAPLLRFGHGHISLAHAEGAEKASGPRFPTSGRVLLEAEDLSVPPDLGFAITGPVRRAAVEFEITGELPAGALAESLEAWRSTGGTLELRRAELDWPPLRVTGDATMALDEHLQPMAAANIRVQGGGKVLDALVATGQMGRDEAALGQVGVAIMSKTTDSGEAEISVSLSLQDRRLTAGPLTLMEVPTLRWPEIRLP